MRKLPVLLILVGLGLIGWVGYDYTTSGEEIARFELAGEAGSTDLISLEPSLNSMRALLSVTYEIELLAGSATAFDYSIMMTGPGSLTVFTAEGQQRDKRDDNTPEYATKTSEQVIKTFAVPAPGEYLLDWRIVPDKARITSRSISLRRNVEPLRIPYLIAGVACFGLGVLLLIRKRRKSI
ncbi:hypothetical protein J0X12_10495 [Sneathiella sp. CAU 1612]|jgi:hypothetical protein|uniref:CopC domain-containing protein n=1 Tax=Sneathiella sedimenti TaxID=2816034 RepID=A0ABS3F7I2_9PROT|nr:hypothetical protein [Sneathiella sedimenti]MBO0334046.1 hypothetical protein [Sneathiella sedimenti]